MVGDVDAGKSTILGRLLVDIGQVTPAKLAELESSSTKRGVPIEYSFLLDAFQVERDQAITLDITRVWVRMPEHDYVFVDAPGHRELIRNLLSGASEVDAAVMVIAADEGITLQTRKQLLFLRWFGFTKLLVAINKLDLVDDPQRVFAERSEQARAFLRQIDIEPFAIIPVSARTGENVVDVAAGAWWSGPSLLDSLGTLEVDRARSSGPLRFIVQDVYRRGASRLIAGRLDSGTLRTGERVVFWPLQTTAVVERIIDWPDELQQAIAGESVAIELDERIFVDRGATASHPDDAPLLGQTLEAEVVWLTHDELRIGESLRLRVGTREIPVSVQHISEVIDPDTVEPVQAEHVGSGDVAIITLTSRELIAADDGRVQGGLSRFVLVRDGTIVAGGRVRAVVARPRSEGATNVTAQNSSVGLWERTVRNAHSGGVFWLTGLPSSGKSSIAMTVQRMLFDRGRSVYVLDGDTLRTTLNVDLGFSDDDRAENVRRTAAVAGEFASAGFIVISALVSPFAADRERARDFSPERFFEVYIACDLPTAEERDVKGLYKRARAGEIAHFTGVSSPYEVPQAPDLLLETVRETVHESAARLMEFIDAKTRL
jgi:bifunctional enzyme CysN/CysC